MIKLTLPAKPEELTKETEDRLIEEFKADNKKAVWRQDYIKDALNKMTHSKCAYSELKLNEEGKDMQIEHFLPKCQHPNLVVHWGNLLPSCNICNRSKSNQVVSIVNPLNDEPKDFLFISAARYYPLNEKGKNTCDVLDLNNWYGLQQKRAESAEIIYEQLIDALDQLRKTTSQASRSKCRNKIRQCLRSCTSEYEFSASLSTNILYERPDKIFKQVEAALREKDLWDEDFEAIKTDMYKCAMPR